MLLANEKEANIAVCNASPVSETDPPRRLLGSDDVWTMVGQPTCVTDGPTLWFS